MHPLFQKRSSRISRFCLFFLPRVIWACFASFDSPSKVRTLSVQKQNKLFGTQLSMPVLQERRGAASKMALRRTSQQRWCFKTIWKKTISACGLQKKERCSTRMAHMKNSFECCVPKLVFWRMKCIMRYSVDTMTSELSSLTSAPGSL